jgi:Lon-like ATP-dependent protease
MSNLALIITLIQFVFAVIIGIYFWNLLRSQQGHKSVAEKDSLREMDKLEKMRNISLTEPLSEKTRPKNFSEIIGQQDGLRTLRAALCGTNPQHVIIYGPPGVGKTAAARLVLEEAKANPLSPFLSTAKFTEIDATTARFDERSIADPLIGSVHDPIYQGAGAMGVAGIPQPKPGAVTKAHGGVLFIDEIGQLHPIQMNKLLKVLEDRKVLFESAYYSPENPNIPKYIHEIFSKGLPADFRMVGATTCMPDQIPPAIRSRCVQVFFRGLLPQEVSQIARNAASKIGLPMEEEAVKVLGNYAGNGREAVNIVQIAAGVVYNEGRKEIRVADVEWVVNSCQIQPRPQTSLLPTPQVGTVMGLAVYGPNLGSLLEIEASAVFKGTAQGRLVITGAVDEEELSGGSGRTIKRKSMARGSVENVLTVLDNVLGVGSEDYYIHVNFPGGIPVDGPSAGVAIAAAIYSSICGKKVDNYCAMTGEVSIQGKVKPVGGIVAKVDAACQAGIRRVFVPRDNCLSIFAGYSNVEIIPVDTIEEIMELALVTGGAVRIEGSNISVSAQGVS